MTNAVYPIYKTAILTAAANTSLDQNTAQDGPFCQLTDTGTTAYSAAHDFQDDVDSAKVGTNQRITTPTVGSVAAGVFDGDDLTYTAVSGNSVEALIIYRHNSGANSTYRLVCYIDTSVTGLPVTPNGGNITVTWNASGILLISDRRLKENILEIGDLLGVLPVYEFNYLGVATRHIGLMAQDVERLVPEAVHQFGRYKAVDCQAAVDAAFKEAA